MLKNVHRNENKYSELFINKHCLMHICAATTDVESAVLDDLIADREQCVPNVT